MEKHLSDGDRARGNLADSEGDCKDYFDPQKTGPPLPCLLSNRWRRFPRQRQHGLPHELERDTGAGFRIGLALRLVCLASGIRSCPRC